MFQKLVAGAASFTSACSSGAITDRDTARQRSPAFTAEADRVDSFVCAAAPWLKKKIAGESVPDSGFVADRTVIYRSELASMYDLEKSLCGLNATFGPLTSIDMSLEMSTAVFRSDNNA